MFNKKKNKFEDRQSHQEFIESRSRKPRTFLWILTTFFIIALGLSGIGVYLGLSHPYFEIKNLDLSGNRNISYEEIKESLGSYMGENIFSTKTSDVENKLRENPKIVSCEVKKILPNKLKINLVENVDLAYISVDNGYLVVGGDLMINRHEGDLTEEEKDKMIRIMNAGYDTLSIGNKLTSKEDEISFIKSLLDHDLSKYTRELDFGEIENSVKIRVNSETWVSLGDTSDPDYKFSLVESILSDLKSKNVKAKEIILNGTDNPIVVMD